MSSQITILNYQVFQTINHRNDYVVIYFKIDGSGTFVNVENYSCFALFNDNWIPMSKKESNLNTPEPISVNGTRHCVFVWDAAKDGVMILNRNQKFQFSLYYRDILCNISSNPTTTLPSLPRTNTPPPPTTTHRPIPVTRIPGQPNDPGGPGLGLQVNIANTSRLDTLIINRPNGVVIDNAPVTRQRPSLNYDYIPAPTSNTINNPNELPTRISGINSVRAGDNFINSISNQEISSINNIVNPTAGQGVQTTVGNLIIGIGESNRSNSSNSSSPIVSQNTTNKSNLRRSPTITVGLSEVEFESTTTALSVINPNTLPIFSSPGDPAPYIPNGNQNDDVIGQREFLEENPENFEYYDGFRRTESFIPTLLKVGKLPSFEYQNFGIEFIFESLFTYPREVAVGESLTISSQFLNTHDSVSEHGQIIIYLKSPTDELFELQRTDYQFIEPDNIIACGLSINTINFNSLGRWDIYSFLIDKNGRTISYANEFINLNNSNSFDGINTQSLGITRSSNRDRPNNVIISSVERYPINPIQDIPGYIITSQNIRTTSLVLRLVFTSSSRTQTVALQQRSNDVSVTILSDPGTLFKTDLSDGNTIIMSSYGQVFPYLNTNQYNYSPNEPALVEDPNIPTNNGGISIVNTSSSNLFVTITPDISPTVATVIFGGNDIIIREASSSVQRLSSTSWNINLQLPIGNVIYKYGYIGMSPNRIPSSVSWNEFTTNSYGEATLNVVGYNGGYISILTSSLDGSYRPVRDEVLKVRLA